MAWPHKVHLESESLESEMAAGEQSSPGDGLSLPPFLKCDTFHQSLRWPSLCVQRERDGRRSSHKTASSSRACAPSLPL